MSSKKILPFRPAKPVVLPVPDYILVTPGFLAALAELIEKGIAGPELVVFLRESSTRTGTMLTGTPDTATEQKPQLTWETLEDELEEFAYYLGLPELINMSTTVSTLIRNYRDHRMPSVGFLPKIPVS